jgi:hypothetical protein
MSARLTKAAIGAAVAGALLLTACGSGEEGDDGIAGAGQGGTTTPEPEESEAPDEPADPDAPEFDFPDTFEVVIDAAEPTGDAATDELLRDHGYALMAMLESYVQQKGTENFSRFWAAPVDSEYLVDFDKFADEGWTLAGVNRFYSRDVVSLEGDRAVITFCEDSSGSWGEEIDTGEKLDSATGEEHEEFSEHRQGLERSGEGPWQVVTSTWETGSDRCAQAAE